MMISHTMFWVLAIGALVASLAALNLAQHFGRREKPVLAFGAISGLASVLAFIAMYFAASKVYVFTYENGRIDHTRSYLFGSTSHGGIDIKADGDNTIIVNHTDRPLHVTTMHYSSAKYAALGGPSKTEHIAPNSALVYGDDLDNFGPSDPPPSKVSSKTDFASRTHITW